MAKDEKKMKALQPRRLHAGRLLLKGVRQAQVARRVGVSRATVCEWNGRLQPDGLPALRRRPRGRPAGLDATMAARATESGGDGPWVRDRAVDARALQPSHRPRLDKKGAIIRECLGDDAYPTERLVFF
jgi:hypothetical protein